jgi:hypothetical protein
VLNKKKIVICIPVHKHKLTIAEINNIKITSKTNKQISKFFILPRSIRVDFFKKKFPNIKIVFFKDKYFSSEMSYNRFLLEKDLYVAFKNYSFLTICQPDAVLIKDISKINLRSLDYIGAPWKKLYKLDIFGIYGLNFISKFVCNYFKKTLIVGNGGLSIRRVSKFLEVTQNIKFLNLVKVGEDIFFSYFSKKYNIKQLSLVLAKKIFCESYSKNLNQIPSVYGFHALNKFNPRLQLKIFNKFLKLY